MKIYIAQLNYKIGDFKNNAKKIISEIEKAKEKKVDIVLFSELAICGYPPEDFLLFDNFLDQMQNELNKICLVCRDICVVLGTVRRNDFGEKRLCNSAVIIIDQKIIGYKDKTLLPTYDVFDERRYFDSNEKQVVFEYKKKRVGILICEDLWEHTKVLTHVKYKLDPVEEIKKLNPDVVLNLSASPYYFKKQDLRINIFSKVSKYLSCSLIICNQVGANDQLVFDGNSMYFDRGNLKSSLEKFKEDFFLVDLNQTYNNLEIQSDPIEDLYNALVLGVKDYFKKQNLKKAVIGLSGGIDSAMVLCIAKEALGKENILSLNMPSRFSSLGSMEDSHKICENLDINLLDIPIDHVFQNYLDLLAPIFNKKPFDTTEENLQARIRGMILMAVSNKNGYVVLSTGNKSEMALGYVTLYGDMCGGLSVLLDVLKTQVYKLAKYVNRKKEIIPKEIIEKEPSAELKENQKDIDDLPNYEIVDNVLISYIEDHLSIKEIIKKYSYDDIIVNDLIKKIHLAEYKRRQNPIGIRVSKKSFTKGRYFPIVQGFVK
ncbi:MAG: Glutamine-dependent NAD(+) synthetase [Candidatus Anoxychlamydiales bacterium]|nr:Glutamine-dependent NAD(+) synthetase [Candidatus Anoxychlamydiales bacterium]